MQMYGFHVSPTLCDVKTLIYVQEAQLDKFHQELVVSTFAADIAHTSQEANSSRGTFLGNRGRGNMFNHGCRSGIGRYTIGNYITYQLYGKYGHSLTTCWLVLMKISCPKMHQCSAQPYKKL